MTRCVSTYRVRKYRAKLRDKLGDIKYKMIGTQYMRQWRVRNNKGKKPHHNTTPPDTAYPDEPSPQTPNSDAHSYHEQTAEDPATYDEVIDLPSGEITESHMVFKHPFTCIISGPSKSGKTYLTKRIIQHKDVMIEPRIEKIIWCYGTPGSIHGLKNEFPDIVLHRGLPNDNWLSSQDSSVPKLLIVDDLMHETNNGFVSKMFTRTSHHENISCIVLTQNLFPDKKDMRDAALNTTYRIIFNNQMDRGQVIRLSARIWGNAMSQYLQDTLDDVKSTSKYAYIMVDNDPHTPDVLRVRTSIFPDDDDNIVYIPLSE